MPILTQRYFTLASLVFPTKFSSGYFFDSYGIVPLVPDIAAFIGRHSTSGIITGDNSRVWRVMSAANIAVY